MKRKHFYFRSFKRKYVIFCLKKYIGWKKSLKSRTGSWVSVYCFISYLFWVCLHIAVYYLWLCFQQNENNDHWPYHGHWSLANLLLIDLGNRNVTTFRQWDKWILQISTRPHLNHLGYFCNGIVKQFFKCASKYYLR